MQTLRGSLQPRISSPVLAQSLCARKKARAAVRLMRKKERCRGRRTGACQWGRMEKSLQVISTQQMTITMMRIWKGFSLIGRYFSAFSNISLPLPLFPCDTPGKAAKGMEALMARSANSSFLPTSLLVHLGETPEIFIRNFRCECVAEWQKKIHNGCDFSSAAG